MALRKNCQLCKAISNPFWTGDLNIWDTPLASSDHFVVLPAIGPLVLGHVMVVSKDHIPSLLAMSQAAVLEFNDLVGRLQMAWGTEPLLLAEHGSDVATEVGPCISHTHVNILPGVPAEWLDLARDCPLLCESDEISSLSLPAGSYFLVGAAGAISRLYNAEHAPSQFIRMKICSKTNEIDWDWHTSRRESLIRATVERWQGVLNV